MAGLGVLLAAVLAAAALLMRLTMTWSRHIERIETALHGHDIAELPTLPATGERELDRIVMALNDAGRRLAEARRRADQLARQVAAGERLAAIGRVAAGVAHEFEIRLRLSDSRRKMPWPAIRNAKTRRSPDPRADRAARCLLRRLLSMTDGKS